MKLIGQGWALIPIDSEKFRWYVLPTGGVEETVKPELLAPDGEVFSSVLPTNHEKLKMTTIDIPSPIPINVIFFNNISLIRTSIKAIIF